MGKQRNREMKLTTALLATAANACFNQPARPAAPENFVQSGRVDWTLLMDSVMGGISTANIGMDASEDYLKWTGQLSLENNGGFAQFYGNIDASLPATTQCDFRLVRLIPLAIFMRHIHVIWERE